jgi:5'-nucleotidase
MRVLISNDDGVEAPGIWALYADMSRHADTVVVAPSSERSAVGHAISVYNDITLSRHVREGRDWAYSIDGTPADCVKMALTTLMKDAPPDIVISGINRGQNTGTSIIYSGTVAAALEATMNGYAAIAVSLAVIAPFKGKPVEGVGTPPAGRKARKPTFYELTNHIGRKPEDFAVAAKFAARLANVIGRRGLPRGVLLNVNVPSIPEDEISGVVISKMGHSVFVDEYQVVNETGGVIAYRNIGDRLINSKEGEDWDDLVLRQHKISITPLHYDLTHHHFVEELKRWMAEEEKEAQALNAEVARELSKDLDAEIVG